MELSALSGLGTELNSNLSHRSGPAGLNLSINCTRILSSSSEKFFEPQPRPLVFDSSVSRVLNHTLFEDVIDLGLRFLFAKLYRSVT